MKLANAILISALVLAAGCSSSTKDKTKARDTHPENMAKQHEIIKLFNDSYDAKNTPGQGMVLDSDSYEVTLELVKGRRAIKFATPVQEKDVWHFLSVCARCPREEN